MASLVSISMQAQWLAGYARMAKFNALAQVASALEVFVKEISDRGLRMTDSMLRTFGQTVELLNALASCAPTKTGRAEGARVLVLDEVAASRLATLAALERVQVAAIGIASVDTGFGLLNENSVDLIVIRTDSAASMAPRLCQAIRRMPKQVNTPILVLLPEGDWERCAVLAMSGANEVIAGRLLNAELSLKVLGHYFRGRLAGAS
jgi:PleD family two-component response regulator